MAITSPDDIAGCAFFYTFHPLDVIIDSNLNISQVTERSTNSLWLDLTNADSDQRPNHVVTEGVYGANFDRLADVGAGEHLDKDGGTQVPFGSNNGTCVMVIKLPEESTDEEIFWTSNNGSFSLSNWALRKTSGNLLGGGVIAADAFTVAPSGWDWGDWVVLTVFWFSLSDTIIVRINSVQVGSGVAIAGSPVNGITIGGAYGGTDRASCTINGLFGYDSILAGQNLIDAEQFAFDNYMPSSLVPPPANGRSYHSFTGQIGTGPFEFSFPIFPEHIELAADQVRVFKKDNAGVVIELFPLGRKDSSGNFQWQFDDPINPAEINLESDNALVAGDELVIMRETRMDKPVANIRITPAAQLRRRDDLNVRGDQILFICQELREIRDIAKILGSGVGDPFEFDPNAGILNTGLFEQAHVADGVSAAFSYAAIEMLPKSAVTHDANLQVFVNRTPVNFTADETALTITITSGAPPSGDAIVVRRITRIDRRWVTHTDADTFSELFLRWDFLDIKFKIEETPDFPTFLKSNALGNRLKSRRVNTIPYSGPGDRFFFGNLPWFGDGAVFVFEDDIPLQEFEDYTVDFLFWDIVFPSGSSHSNIRIQTTNPFHAFHVMPFDVPNTAIVEPVDLGAGITEENGEITVTGIAIILSKFVDSADALVVHTLVEIGEGTGIPGDAKGGIVLLRTDDLGSAFPGSTLISATITVENVKSHDFVALNQFDAMDETFAGKTTYAQLSAEYVVAATKPSVGVTLGEQVLDAKDLFQAIADLDTIQEAFLVWHEEFLPPNAVSGTIETTLVFRFTIKYLRDPGAVPAGTGDTQINVTAQPPGSDPSDSTAYFYQGSATGSPQPPAIYGITSHAMGGRVQVNEPETIDPHWHEIQFNYGITIVQGAQIHKATMTVKMNSNNAGGGNIATNTLPDTQWNTYAGFLAAVAGPIVGGPNGFGEVDVDITSIVQAQADAGPVSGISLYHYNGASPSDARSVVDFAPEADRPTLAIDLTQVP